MNLVSVWEQPGILSTSIMAEKAIRRQSTKSNLHNPDRARLRADILAMREQGMSYRKIGMVLSIHWTQIGQVARSISAE